MNEHQIQCAFIKWLGYQHPYAAEVIYATPNAGKRTLTQGAYLKAEGMRSGVPDLCIPIAMQGYSSLYIELKTPKGSPTSNQIVWIEKLNKHGNLALICRGLDEAMQAVNEYFKGYSNGR